MVPSPVDKKIMLFLGTKGVNWITEDCGGTVRALNTGRNIHELLFHPTESQWMLAAAWTNCDEFEKDEKCQIYKELYVSYDSGNSWKFLKNFIVQFKW